MENVIKELKERLTILNIVANQRGFSSKKKESKKIIPEYERAISILERALAELSNENGALPIPDASNCYAADCLIQDSCLRFKQQGCNKDCKLYM